ncbi:MAG: PHP domain-containing protein [Bacillota bacterium]
MKKNKQELINNLNSTELSARLKNLRKLKEMIDKGEIKKPEKREDKVNNHIHTTFSFSPYSPTRAVWEAFKAGLVTAGIMDHDTIKGAEEFIEAGKVMGMATTVGMECRCDFSDTPLQGKRINSPDQKSMAYVAIHGVPHTQIEIIQQFFQPYREERNKRNVKMIENINQFFSEYNINLDFEKDVIPISEYENGGTITERHLLFALGDKLIKKFGKGKKLLDKLQNEFAHVFTPKLKKYLSDPDNEFYQYDLLGLLKKDTGYFYVKADKECPDIKVVLKLVNETGAISAYAYLGDIEQSVTGDKKAQKFEDEYLEFLFEVLDDLGFNAITYMPSRNTEKQLQRVKKLCEKRNFFQISGEDINSPRQSFICEDLQKEEFKNLVDSTWALIGHEKIATRDINRGMFSQKTIEKYPELKQRINKFKKAGKNNL